MTNFEKYSDYVIAIGFGLLDGKPTACCNVNCGECGFYRTESCNIARIEWLKAEYKESKKINIPDDTPIDAKVLVSTDGIVWYKRHYAGFKEGEHYVWVAGKTSWSSTQEEMYQWEYMKLYE